jgi:hypothetical protein
VSASFFLNVPLARAEIAISSPYEMNVLEKHQYLILRPERIIGADQPYPLALS